MDLGFFDDSSTPVLIILESPVKTRPLWHLLLIFHSYCSKGELERGDGV